MKSLISVLAFACATGTALAQPLASNPKEWEAERRRVVVLAEDGQFRVVRRPGASDGERTQKYFKGRAELILSLLQQARKTFEGMGFRIPKYPIYVVLRDVLLTRRGTLLGRAWNFSGISWIELNLEELTSEAKLALVCAHELFHVIQWVYFGSDAKRWNSAVWLLEATASWAESACFPEYEHEPSALPFRAIRPWCAYGHAVTPLFRDPDEYPGHKYLLGLFFKFAGKKIVLRTLEGVRSRKDAAQALIEAFEEPDSLWDTLLDFYAFCLTGEGGFTCECRDEMVRHSRRMLGSRERVWFRIHPDLPYSSHPRREGPDPDAPYLVDGIRLRLAYPVLRVDIEPMSDLGKGVRLYATLRGARCIVRDEAGWRLLQRSWDGQLYDFSSRVILLALPIRKIDAAEQHANTAFLCAPSEFPRLRDYSVEPAGSDRRILLRDQIEVGKFVPEFSSDVKLTRFEIGGKEADPERFRMEELALYFNAEAPIPVTIEGRHSVLKAYYLNGGESEPGVHIEEDRIRVSNYVGRSTGRGDFGGPVSLRIDNEDRLPRVMTWTSSGTYEDIWDGGRAKNLRIDLGRNSKLDPFANLYLSADGRAAILRLGGLGKQPDLHWWVLCWYPSRQEAEKVLGPVGLVGSYEPERTAKWLFDGALFGDWTVPVYNLVRTTLDESFGHGEKKCHLEAEIKSIKGRIDPPVATGKVSIESADNFRITGSYEFEMDVAQHVVIHNPYDPENCMYDRERTQIKVLGRFDLPLRLLDIRIGKDLEFWGRPDGEAYDKKLDKKLRALARRVAQLLKR